MDEWIKGRKRIMQALDVSAWSTVCRWRRKYGLKFCRLPNGQPAILLSVLNQWLSDHQSKRTPKTLPRCLLPKRYLGV